MNLLLIPPSTWESEYSEYLVQSVACFNQLPSKTVTVCSYIINKQIQKQQIYFCHFGICYYNHERFSLTLWQKSQAVFLGLFVFLKFQNQAFLQDPLQDGEWPHST